ncbi:GTPase HflX [Paenibacillus nicotianae]|uniref:GTPase HflX n=1 Tax=Paenibacillus nicotianae TaxID=1526551 RepID=A0ABW4UUY0_9BACL
MKNETHGVEIEIQPRAILVSLVTQNDKRAGVNADGSMQELVSLAKTAGVEVLEQVIQNKEKPDFRWFIGKGKVEEIRILMDSLDANSVIFDQELSGAQVRNLEAALDAKIIDRTQLILDIFAQRAKTREGIIQVELAQHGYLLPRLSGQGSNLSRLGGGIGARGPGETKLETDRRHIRTRITDLKRQLEEVTRHRTLYRERRKKAGAVQVALVGYTNAGKSTLLKQLTDADVYVQDQLFATLDPTSRNLDLPGGKTVVLTDTVGFIQNLPHDLIAAFRATLEEVNEADLILHVVDASSEMREEQMKVVDDLLQELGSNDKQQVVLYNKTDLCTPEQLEMLPDDATHMRISAYKESDLERILNIIQDQLAGGTKTYRIPAERGDLISQLYQFSSVLEQEYEENDAVIKVEINAVDYEKYGHRLQEYEIK